MSLLPLLTAAIHSAKLYNQYIESIPKSRHQRSPIVSLARARKSVRAPLQRVVLLPATLHFPTAIHRGGTFFTVEIETCERKRSVFLPSMWEIVATGPCTFTCTTKTRRPSYSQTIKDISRRQMVPRGSFLQVRRGSHRARDLLGRTMRKSSMCRMSRTRYADGNCAWSVNNYSRSLESKAQLRSTSMDAAIMFRAAASP